MALRKIYREGEAALKKKAKTVTRFESRLATLLDDMKETLKDSNGVGLAAPQVGILKRAIVIDAGEKEGVVELINPEIVERSGEQVFYEGCLSYPGYYGNVGRPETVTVRAANRGGDPVVYRATGLYAVACCHEMDHLEGRMFMPQVKGRLYTLDEVKKMREEDEAKAAPKTPAPQPGAKPPVGDGVLDVPPPDAEASVGDKNGDLSSNSRCVPDAPRNVPDAPPPPPGADDAAESDGARSDGYMMRVEL